MSDSKSRDMRDHIILKEHKLRDIASCNVCYARNYDTDLKPTIGKKVDCLYDLLIGGSSLLQITLCGECLLALHNTLSDFIE